MDVFTIIVIIIILLAIFRLLDIGLNIILALVLAFGIIYYIGSIEKQEQLNQEKMQYDKHLTLRPPHPQLAEYKDLTDFFFSIQDMYHYSPINYEDMVDSVNDFMTIYKDTKLFPVNAGLNYEIAQKKKSDALNALHAIVYNVFASIGGKVIEKNNRAREELSYILSNYLEEIRKANIDYIREFGYNIQTKVVENEFWPKAANYFGDEDATAKGEYTYELY